MKKCTITVKDEVWCYLNGLTPTDMTALWDAFGIYKDGYFFAPSYKTRRWDGKIRFVQKIGKTYLRLIDRVLPYLEKWGYDIELNDERQLLTNPEGRATTDLFSAHHVNGQPIMLRPYQVDAVNTLVDAGSGILLAGTGAGKTLMCAATSRLYADAGYRVMTIVPSGDLVTQTGEWYEACGLDTGYYSGDQKDIDHQHVVSTWQALQYNPELLQLGFGAVIFDEAHGIRAEVAQKLLNEDGKHIAFRFGVTGTLPKAETDQLSIISAVGPVLKEIPAKWLIENGYLAQVEIEPVEIHETNVGEDFKDYDAEKAFLAKSEPRMEAIADLIISKCATHGNTLVLVNSIPFGKKLAALIKDAVFLYGASKKDERQDQYSLFEERDDLIVIASSGIASTGISIDRVFCLIMVDSGRSFIRNIQSIGRGLRRGRGKNSVHVVDVHSKLKWAKKHYKERAQSYVEAQYPILPKQSMKVRMN